jgi:hypothetical protein
MRWPEAPLVIELRAVAADGWSLALLSDRRGQAAVLRAFDALIEQRRT